MNIDSKKPLLKLSVPSFRIAIALLVVAFSIAMSGAIAHAIRHQYIMDTETPVDAILRRFDLVVEPSLVQWFSSSLHLIISLTALIIARTFSIRTDLRWLGISAIFLLASIDESIMLHELMDRPVRELLSTSGFFTIAWIIPGSMIALLIAAAYLPFLLSLDRRIATRMIISGAVFLSGAILMEIPGGYFYELYGFTTWHYITSYAIEELLELTGAILFLHTLLLYAEGRINESQFEGRSLLVIEFTGRDTTNVESTQC